MNGSFGPPQCTQLTSCSEAAENLLDHFPGKKEQLLHVHEGN